MNDRLTKIWLRKADGGIHFHCQIGISPGRRVLNEQSWLGYEGFKTSFLKGSQVTDKQQWVRGRDEAECAHCSASLSIAITTRHSLVRVVNTLSSEHYGNTTLDTRDQRNEVVVQGSVSVECENLVLHHNRKPAGVPAGTTACQASSSRLV